MKEKLITERVQGQDLKEGMTLKTWMGNKLIMKFKEYKGTLDFVHNIIIFSDGTSMSNSNQTYDVIIDSI